MSITRAAFEAALGTPLEKLVPDRYRLDEVELLKCMQKVEMLAALNVEQLKAVVDRMTEVKFRRGEDVIRQGDAGDALYVITRGTASVLRWEENSAVGSDLAAAKRLATLGQWHAFGERALLKNETRYASVRAESEELHVMSIGRTTFEAAVGLSLASALSTSPA